MPLQFLYDKNYSTLNSETQSGRLGDLVKTSTNNALLTTIPKLGEV